MAVLDFYHLGTEATDRTPLNQECRDYVFNLFVEASKRGVRCLVNDCPVMESPMMLFCKLRGEYENIPEWHAITLRTFQLIEDILDNPNKCRTSMQISFEEHFSVEEKQAIRDTINKIYTNPWKYRYKEVS